MCKGPEVGVCLAHFRNNEEPNAAEAVSKRGGSRRRDLRDGS